MATKKQPVLSPHLQIYRPQFTSITSICHRITGFLLYFAIIASSWALLCFAYFYDGVVQYGANCECVVYNILKNIFVIVACVIAFALYYHLFNGIRHLFWDIGKGLDLHVARKTAFMVLFSALFMTIFSIVTVLGIL